MLKNVFQKQSILTELLEQSLITEEEQAEIEAKMENENLSEMAAISKIVSTNYNCLKFVAKHNNIDFISLKEVPKISNALLSEVPRNLITLYHILPFGYGANNAEIRIASPDPLDSQIIENLENRTNKKMIMFYASWSDIDDAVTQYLGTSEAIEAATAYIESLDGQAATGNIDLNDLTSDSPIVTIVDTLLQQAAKMKASDIHIEPFENRLRIRYRIDGVLAEQPSYSMSLHAAIISRLKIMGGMDISEKRIPQDGRISFFMNKIEYDVRVSMLPTVYGEKCVMRLALRANLQRDKKNLGLTDYDLKIFDRVFSNPNGIILVTGPTGSGKSTTLYTALSELSTEEVNVVTVEDPVEANVDGVNQVKTNDRAGLTFASALRSILRQDPDIIMIGEIRDQETAEIAVQAAITGHLVVSTLHTNSSAATVSRLVNMGLAPYLVADSVVGIMAQRLVRRLCPHCRKQRMATPEELIELGVKKQGVQLPIYDAGKCGYCNNTGFSGRIAVYEIMEVSPKIKDMIVDGARTSDIKEAAIANGMHTLHRSAAELVLRGTTTMSEMRKVSSEY